MSVHLLQIEFKLRLLAYKLGKLENKMVMTRMVTVVVIMVVIMVMVFRNFPRLFYRVLH